MDALVPESKIRRGSIIWPILTYIFFVIAVVMTVLFAWVILKPEHREKIRNTATNLPNIDAPCPRHPPLFRLPSPLPTQIKKALNIIDAHLVDLVESPKITGNMSAMSIKIVYQNTTLFTGNYGSKVFKGSLAPDDHTKYRIGSVTKIFPVLLLYKLYEDGLISSLDDPLNKYAPNFSIKSPFNKMYNITLRQIASQMSGLPREAPCGYRCKNTTTKEQLFLLKDNYLVVKPWTIPSYSNLGYVLLGRILTENLLKKTFETWVQENILDPLDMKNTGFEINKEVKKDTALPYYRNGLLMPISDIGWANPAGGMYSTTEDLMKLAKIFIHPDSQRLFKPENLREMLTSNFITRDGLWLWGSPWEMRFIEGYLIRQKIGNIDSYNAVFSVIPELELALCTLVNVKPRVKNVGFTLVDFLHKTLIPSFKDTFSEMLRKKYFPIPAKPFIGNYSLSRENMLTGEIENFTVNVSEREGALHVVNNSANFYNFSISYIGDPLVFRAAYSLINTNYCPNTHFGAFAMFTFAKPGDDGLSRTFSSKEWKITAIRI